MSGKKQALDAIMAQGILPLFFYKDVEVSLQVIRALYKAGIRAFEYTNRGEEALDNFSIIKKAQLKEMPDLHFGIGTIKVTSEAEAFISAGADFIVAPVVNSEVANIAARHNMLWIPGCMTPTEILAAQEHGAELIKIFPANILGPAFVESIKDLFPGQLFLPTGGVDLSRENISAWFNAGVAAVGMGSKLISKSVLENQLYGQLYTDTVNVLAVIKQSR
jgi:2-dehydro-3-deoxyphosphogluconate aldolase/(4S)-4-hydroxy-2-oxoglutarate aldolase